MMMTDPQIDMFPEYVAQQLYSIRAEGHQWPPATPERFRYKHYYREELAFDKKPVFHMLASLDTVKVSRYEAECINLEHSREGFSFNTGSDYLRVRALLATIREVAPYVDMCPMALLVFHKRDEPTMYQLQLKTIMDQMLWLKIQ